MSSAAAVAHMFGSVASPPLRLLGQPVESSAGAGEDAELPRWLRDVDAANPTLALAELHSDRTFRRFAVLLGRAGDTRFSGTADAATVEQAAHWLTAAAREALSAGEPWYEPHITSSDGEVAFEWARGARRLTILVGPDSVEFARLTGATSELNEGTAETPVEAVAHLRWVVEALAP